MTTSGASFGGKAKFEGPGGTPGGFGEFLLGLLLAGIGAYLLLSNVQVHTSPWPWGGGGGGFGISVIPIALGVGVLFFSGRSRLGWVLTVGGFLFVIVGVIARMDVYFRPTSLWNTLIMIGLLAGGLGLIARSLRSHRRPSSE